MNILSTYSSTVSILVSSKKENIFLINYYAIAFDQYLGIENPLSTVMVKECEIVAIVITTVAASHLF